ncbi:MAG: sensory rhodopsin transducer [Planctomycetota bacterium]|nr:sensory rhodopsin transducer [Planctomycetota bacterium]
MLQSFIQDAAWATNRYGIGAGNLSAAGEMLNALYGDALKVHGVRRVVVVSADLVALAVNGICRVFHKNFGRYMSLTERSIDLNLRAVREGQVDAAAAELKQALAEFVLDGEGAHVWIVPDGYMAALSENERRWAREGGGYFSHESMCVQNTGARAARCELFVYFEAPGREILRHAFEVPANRSIHLRLDLIPGMGGEPFVPKSMPVGYKIVSYDAPVVVQGSRILTSGQGSEFGSFGTTMAWTPSS